MDEIKLEFHDAGDKQRASGYHQRGSMEEWSQIVPLVAQHPKAATVLVGSVAAPMLKILGACPFAMDIAGITSAGKTTVLRCAASEWGNPNERLPGSAIRTWAGTQVSHQRNMVALQGIPYIVDDTKRADHPDIISKCIYDLVGGSEKQRGSLEGSQVTGQIETVKLSCGEQRLTSFAKQHGGVHARVIQMSGLPFGEQNAETAQLVDQLNSIVFENYGHAGPAFVKFLLKNRAEWSKWRSTYHMFRNGYAKDAEGDAVAIRLGEHFAVLELTANIAMQVLDFPFDYQKSVLMVWEDIRKMTSGADVALSAMQDVLSWCRSHADRFYEDGDKRIKKSPMGMAGRRHRHGDISFYPQSLHSLLSRDLGYECQAVMETWRDRKWIVVGSDRGFTKKVRVGPDDGSGKDAIVISGDTVEKFS